MARPVGILKNDNVNKMYQSYLSGNTLAKVAIEFNCSKQNIRQLFKLRNLPIRSQSEATYKSMTNERIEKLKQKLKGLVPWNKSLTKETDASVLKYAITKRKVQLKTCPWCKNKFEYNKHIGTKFCTRECYLKWVKGKQFSPGFKKGHPSPRKGTKKIYAKYCLYCENRFLTSRNIQKFCSINCNVFYNFKGKKIKKETIIKRVMARKNITNFVGYSTSKNKLLRHSLDWKLWREKVFERDNFTCQNCFKTNCYLEPHHIFPVKECIKINNDKLVFDINNGVTLCRVCHKKTHNWKIKKESD